MFSAVHKDSSLQLQYNKHQHLTTELHRVTVINKVKYQFSSTALGFCLFGFLLLLSLDKSCCSNINIIEFNCQLNVWQTFNRGQKEGHETRLNHSDRFFIGLKKDSWYKWTSFNYLWKLLLKALSLKKVPDQQGEIKRPLHISNSGPSWVFFH